MAFISNPIFNWYQTITPSDTVDFVLPDSVKCCTGIYVGVGGDVTAVREDGIAVTFVAAITGTILPIKARRVNATATSADSLLALFNL